MHHAIPISFIAVDFGVNPERSLVEEESPCCFVCRSKCPVKQQYRLGVATASVISTLIFLLVGSNNVSIKVAASAINKELYLFLRLQMYFKTFNILQNPQAPKAATTSSSAVV